MTIFRRRLAITTAVVVLLGLASVAPQCSNTTGLVVAQDRTPTKHRVPAPERQTAILKLLDETYGLSKASTLPKKKQVAEALMGLASLPETEQDERYVVFLTALPLLREVGDFAPYSAALDQLLVAFAVDADAIQTKYLSEFMADCKASSKLEPVVQEAVACTGHLAREHKFSQAKQLQDSAEAQAKKLSAAKLVKSLAEIRVLLTDHEKSFIAQEQAQKRLATTPDDSASNFARGVWLAVFEARWQLAIPNLEQCSDTKWKGAATADAKAVADIESHQAAGDAWWEVAQSATGQLKLGALLRSQYWYGLYERDAKSPLAKARLSKRQEELAALMKIDDPLVESFLSQSIPGIEIGSKAPSKSSSPGASEAASAGQADRGTLTIVEAKYGTRDRWTDLTERVTKAAQSGRLIMRVSLELIGRDPWFGASKRLELRYRLDGIDYENWFADDSVVQLDPNDDEPAGAGRKLVILEALYGNGILGESKWVDVMEPVKAKLQGDRLSASVKSLVAGTKPDEKDPPKSLYIRCFQDGEIQTFAFLKDDTVQLGNPPPKKALPKRRSKDDSGLVVVSAAYGANSTWVDLTDQAAVAAKPGRLIVGVTQASLTGSDPVPYQAKRFRLRYRLGGRLYEQYWGENSIVYIDSHKPNAANKPELQILEARYGTGIMSDKNWQDVTSQVRSKVSGNGVSVPLADLLKKGPANAEKRNRGLFVRYSYAGELRAIYVEDGGTLAINQ